MFTLFPLINAEPQIGAPALGIHIEISASPQISAVSLNALPIRIAIIFY